MKILSVDLGCFFFYGRVCVCIITKKATPRLLMVIMSGHRSACSVVTSTWRPEKSIDQLTHINSGHKKDDSFFFSSSASIPSHPWQINFNKKKKKVFYKRLFTSQAFSSTVPSTKTDRGSDFLEGRDKRRRRVSSERWPEFVLKSKIWQKNLFLIRSE